MNKRCIALFFCIILMTSVIWAEEDNIDSELGDFSEEESSQEESQERDEKQSAEAEPEEEKQVDESPEKNEEKTEEAQAEEKKTDSEVSGDSESAENDSAEDTGEEPEAVSEKKKVKKVGDKKETVPADRLKYVSAALKADLTVPRGVVDTTYAFHLELSYILPWWNPHLAFGVSAGYYPLSGKGQNIDNQIGLYDYSWEIKSIPVFIGPSVYYGIGGLDWLKIFAETGFAMVFSFSDGYTFNGRTEASDTAFGYYGGVGASFSIPYLERYGSVFTQFKYTGAFLDYNYPEFNDKPGDLGGFSVLIGYRYSY